LTAYVSRAEIPARRRTSLQEEKTMGIKMIVLNTPEDVGSFAADLFELEIKARPACVLGLATGSTPLPLYRQLVARCKEGRIDFSRVRTFNLDEYEGLAPDHPQSYRRF